MPLSFPDIDQFAFKVGQTPWSAADALVGLLGLDRAEFVGDQRVQGDPAQTKPVCPSGSSPIPALGKLSGIEHSSLRHIALHSSPSAF